MTATVVPFTSCREQPIRRTKRGFEVALADLLGPAFVALAPVVPAIRRRLNVRAADVEFVWLSEHGGVRHAMVSLTTGQLLWGLGRTWTECVHASALVPDPLRPGTPVCFQCGCTVATATALKLAAPDLFGVVGAAQASSGALGG